MRETETFYWKNENGEIKEHHISEFRTFLERETGSCVSSVEYRQTIEQNAQLPSLHGMEGRKVVDQGSTPEKEIISPIAISK